MYYANQYGTIATRIENTFIKNVEKRVQPVKKQEHDNIKIINEIVALSWVDFHNVLTTYFIIPIKRNLSRFIKDKYPIPIELRKSLSKKHVEDLQGIFTENNDEFSFGTIIIEDEELIDKCNRILEELALISMYKNTMRFTTSASKALETYLKQFILYGIIDHLFRNTIHSADVSTYKLFIHILSYYNKNKVITDPEEIRKRIEIRNEKERSHIIQEFDRMTEEERTIELIQKKLGIGKWAVGGSKLIWEYNKDYYDLESEKRYEAGISDFPDQLEQSEDALGFRNSGEEAGYDNSEQNDD
jgi:hypothetical protein